MTATEYTKKLEKSTTCTKVQVSHRTNLTLKNIRLYLIVDECPTPCPTQEMQNKGNLQTYLKGIVLSSSINKRVAVHLRKLS